MATRIAGNLVYGHHNGEHGAFIPFTCPDLTGYRKVINLGHAAYEEWMAVKESSTSPLIWILALATFLLFCGWGGLACAMYTAPLPDDPGLSGLSVVCAVFAVMCFLGFSRSMKACRVRIDVRDIQMEDVVKRYSGRDDLYAWEIVPEREVLYLIHREAVQPIFLGCGCS